MTRRKSGHKARRRTDTGGRTSRRIRQQTRTRDDKRAARRT